MNGSSLPELLYNGFEGRWSLESVTYEHAAGFINLSILTVHRGRSRDTGEAFHHEVLSPTDLLLVAGVSGILSHHHRGE